MGRHVDYTGYSCRDIPPKSAAPDAAQPNGATRVGSALVESCPDLRNGCLSGTGAVFARREVGSPGNERGTARGHPNIPGGD